MGSEVGEDPDRCVQVIDNSVIGCWTDGRFVTPCYHYEGLGCIDQNSTKVQEPDQEVGRKVNVSDMPLRVGKLAENPSESFESLSVNRIG